MCPPQKKRSLFLFRAGAGQFSKLPVWPAGGGEKSKKRSQPSDAYFPQYSFSGGKRERNGSALVARSRPISQKRQILRLGWYSSWKTIIALLPLLNLNLFFFFRFFPCEKLREREVHGLIVEKYHQKREGREISFFPLYIPTRVHTAVSHKKVFFRPNSNWASCTECFDTKYSHGRTINI